MNSGVAADVVCVRGHSGFECSEFYVKFLSNVSPVDSCDLEKAGMFRDGQTTDFSTLSTLSVEEIAQQHIFFEKSIQWLSIWCNGELCGPENAFVGPDNRMCFFNSSTRSYSTQPSSRALRDMNLRLGKNVLLIKHSGLQTMVDFEMWLYDVNDRLIVMDIDGTITKSGTVL